MLPLKYFDGVVFKDPCSFKILWWCCIQRLCCI